VAEEKRHFRDDQRQRNAVLAKGYCEAVGKIGQGNRRYGLGLITEKLAVTRSSAIALIVLVITLEKFLRSFVLFICYFRNCARSPLWSRRVSFSPFPPPCIRNPIRKSFFQKTTMDGQCEFQGFYSAVQLF
jgi:hypothetical protein